MVEYARVALPLLPSGRATVFSGRQDPDSQVSAPLRKLRLHLR